MSFFRPDPLGPNAERNRLKITSNYVRIAHASTDLSSVQVNIPSQYLIEGAIIEHVPQLAQAIRLQSGLDIGRHRPLVGVEACFLLRNEKNPGLIRIFVGSVQRSAQLFNQISPPREVRSVNELKRLVQENISPDLLSEKLDSSVLFPNSEWPFEAVVSGVLNFNARVKLPTNMRRFQKLFYQL